MKKFNNKGFELSTMIGVMIGFLIFLIIIVVVSYRAGAM